MSTVDLDALRSLYIARLVEAWAQQNIALDVIEQSLRVAVTKDDDGPVLAIDLLGVAQEYGFDGTHEEATEIVASAAVRMANDLEGDRWTSGDGWREYRS